MQLTKVTETTEEHAFHVWIKDGVETKEEISIEEYLALGIKGASQPQKTGHEWKASFKAFKYDTPDGFMQDGQYSLTGTSALVKLPGKRGNNIDKKFIVNNVISDEGIRRI